MVTLASILSEVCWPVMEIGLLSILFYFILFNMYLQKKREKHSPHGDHEVVHRNTRE